MSNVFKILLLAVCLLASPAFRDSAAAATGSPGRTTPVYLENIDRDARLAEHAFFLLDPAGGLSIEQAGAPAMQNSYRRLSDGVPLTGSGVFWLRFSLAEAGPRAPGARHPAGLLLDPPPGAPPARMYVAQDFARNGDVRRWREIDRTPEGFPLPDPRGLPLTVYMKFDGAPGLWFNPLLTAAGPERPPDYLPLAAQILLGLSIPLLILRGVAGREEWRLWGAAVAGCALVQVLFGRQSPELTGFYLTALPPLLAPGLVVMLLPHLGRHLLQSRERRLMDYLLIALSLPGAAVALLPLFPGLGWSVKLLPLAPLLLMPTLFVAVMAMTRRLPGGATYFLICLMPFLGALLALLGLCLAEARLDFDSPLYRLGPNLTYYGYAAAALIMVFGGRGKAEPKEDFFPLEASMVNAYNSGGDPALRLYAEEPAPIENDAVAGGHDESEIRVTRLYTPEPAAPENGAGADESPAAPGLAPQDWLPDASEQLAESEAGLIDERLADSGPVEDSTVGPLPEAWDAPPLSVADPLDDGVTRSAETTPVPPPVIEDAAGEAAPYDFTAMVRYRDTEEPGLVILKPAPRAGQPLPPFFEQAAFSELTPPEFASGPLPPIEAAGQPSPLIAAVDEPTQPGISLAECGAEADKPVPFPQDLREILAEAVAAEERQAGHGVAPDDSLNGLDEALNCLDRLARAEAMNQADSRAFNLSSLVRRIHAETVDLAESRGIALSWFVSPSLSLFYQGDEKTLRLTLNHMLRGAVESARDGAIQLAVRPAPEGDGLIRFSLTDSALTPDSPRPPARLLSRAWELACASQGSFSTEFVPERGTSINFSLRLKAVADAAGDGSAENETGPERPAPAADSAGTQPLRLDEMTGLAELAEQTAGARDLDGPLAAEVLDGVALSPVTRPERDGIVIADPAASGRRLIARRLDDLPYKKIEAVNLSDAVRACSWGNVALLILDGELPAEEVEKALRDINAEAAAAGRPPVPSLCLLSHLSQGARLLKAGCAACQIKSESREEFQALARQLIAADPPPAPASDSVRESSEPRPSMLDMIVFSLDSENAAAESESGPPPAPAAPGAGYTADGLTKLAGRNGEYMDSSMVSMIPGFLEVMPEELHALEESAAGQRFDQVRDITARMRSQSRTYGLSNLERMAACVERAAQAKDREAVNDLAEELLLMCRRYLASLRETYEKSIK